MEMEAMKQIDITKVERADLIDIREVQINNSQKQDGKVKDFIRQVKNPYCYKYGDYIVKINFEDTEVTLTERLREMILKAADAV